MMIRVSPGVMKVLILLFFVIFIGTVIVSFTLPTTSQWENVDIVENVYPDYEEIALEDNFYAGSLNDVIMSAQTCSDAEEALEKLNSDSPNIQGDYLLDDNILALLEGEVTVSGPDYAVLRAYYDMLVDEDTRDAQGVGVIQEYVDEIDSISSLDEMSEFLSTGGGAALTYMFWELYLGNSEVDGRRTVDAYNDGSYINDGFDTDGFTEYYSRMLERFPELDMETYVDSYLDVIDVLSYVIDDAEFTEYSYMDLMEYDFPFAGIFESYAEVGVDVFRMDASWNEAFESIYTEENLDGLKSIAMFKLMDESILRLDRASAEIAFECTSEYTVLYDDYTYNGPISWLLNKYYMAAYCTPEDYQFVSELSDRCIESAKEYYGSIEWLSDQSRARMVERLDSMKFRIFGPTGEQWDQLDFTQASGDTFYDLFISIKRCDDAIMLEQAGMEKGTYWPIDLNSYEFNMYYLLDENTVCVFLGYYQALTEGRDLTAEYILGTIGAAIGHEITHAFDYDYVVYTPDGIYDPDWLMTESEQRTFEQRAERMADAISWKEVAPGVYLDGYQLLSESMADMGGMALSLNIAKDLDGFDYDEFFRSLVQMEYYFTLEEDYLERLDYGVHPPAMFRVNLPVQQFDEFYETYGITEEDGMYLSPEDRFIIW